MHSLICLDDELVYLGYIHSTCLYEILDHFFSDVLIYLMISSVMFVNLVYYRMSVRLFATILKNMYSYMFPKNKIANNMIGLISIGCSGTRDRRYFFRMLM